jgi:two-component system chemotaxis response regulator CheB
MPLSDVESAPVTGVGVAAERVVVLGASTGGPPALERVFSGLSGDLPAAYLVVQHLPSGFTDSFARRLTKIAGFPVREGRTGIVVQNGIGYLAPAGQAG